MSRVKHILLRYVGPWIEFIGPGEQLLTACNRVVKESKVKDLYDLKVTCKQCIKKAKASAPECEK